MLSLEGHNWISEWNTRQPPKEIAAAPLLMQRLPAGRKKQTLKVSEFQSRYIVSSKIWREIISRWFDVLCTGSFCRYRYRSNNFAEGVNFRPFSLPTYWGANWKLNDRPNGICPRRSIATTAKSTSVPMGRKRREDLWAGTTFGQSGTQKSKDKFKPCEISEITILFVLLSIPMSDPLNSVQDTA